MNLLTLFGRKSGKKLSSGESRYPLRVYLIRSLNKWILAFAGMTLILIKPALAKVTAENPCLGANALLSLVNRPSAADSPCVVPDKSMVFEGGYQYQTLIYGGHSQNFFQPAVRFGLPANTEFVTLIPNFYENSINPRSGFGSTSVGLKHELFYNSKLVFSIEDLITPSSGSLNFGNQGFGNAFNGILSYSFNERWSMTAMLGYSTQTLAPAAGGGRFSAIFPDLLIAWSKDKILVYGEVYGLTKTAPNESLGLDGDAGLLYLIRKNISLDIEVGKRFYGELGGFNLYFGAGLAVLMET